MEREAVDSSMIRSVQYDPESKTLEVEFNKGGAVWQYSELPPEEYGAFRAAGSLGKYFLANIKGRYPEARV
jgi:hypothetical protein